MRISTFIPAVLAIGVFAASTQARPTIQQQEYAVEMLKRGTGNVLDALVKLFVDAQTDVLVNASVDLETYVCADVIVKLNANTEALGLIKTHLDVKNLDISAKTQSDIEVKAMVKADVNALVIANIDAHVRSVVGGLCSTLDKACLSKKASTIVTNVVKLINADIGKLVVKINADVAAKAKIRVNAYINSLKLNLGIANVSISAIIHIRSDIDIHLKAFVDVCAKLLLNAKLVAGIAAL